MQLQPSVGERGQEGPSWGSLVFDEGRRLGRAAAFIKGPADQIAMLIWMKGYFVVSHGGNALLGNPGLVQ